MTMSAYLYVEPGVVVKVQEPTRENPFGWVTVQNPSGEDVTIFPNIGVSGEFLERLEAAVHQLRVSYLEPVEPE
jgi:hypothetical protein